MIAAFDTLEYSQIKLDNNLLFQQYKTKISRISVKSMSMQSFANKENSYNFLKL